VPSKNRVHEDPADGAERLAVVGQAPAQLERKCDHELAEEVLDALGIADQGALALGLLKQLVGPVLVNRRAIAAALPWAGDW
jgi:hypothetical protein